VLEGVDEGETVTLEVAEGTPPEELAGAPELVGGAPELDGATPELEALTKGLEALTETPAGDEALTEAAAGDEALTETPAGDEALAETPAGDEALAETPAGDEALTTGDDALTEAMTEAFNDAFIEAAIETEPEKVEFEHWNRVIRWALKSVTIKNTPGKVDEKATPWGFEKVPLETDPTLHGPVKLACPRAKEKEDPLAAVAGLSMKTTLALVVSEMMRTLAVFS